MPRKKSLDGLFTEAECKQIAESKQAFNSTIGRKKTSRGFRTAFKKSHQFYTSSGNTCLHLHSSVMPADLGFGPRNLPIVFSMGGEHVNRRYGEKHLNHHKKEVRNDTKPGKKDTEHAIRQIFGRKAK